MEVNCAASPGGMNRVLSQQEAHQLGSLAGVYAVHGHPCDGMLLLRDEAPTSLSMSGCLPGGFWQIQKRLLPRQRTAVCGSWHDVSISLAAEWISARG